MELLRLDSFLKHAAKNPPLRSLHPMISSLASSFAGGEVGIGRVEILARRST